MPVMNDATLGIPVALLGALFLLFGARLSGPLLPLLAALGGAWIGRELAIVVVGAPYPADWMAAVAVGMVLGIAGWLYPKVGLGAAAGAVGAILAGWVTAAMGMAAQPLGFFVPLAAALVLAVAAVALKLPPGPVISAGTALFGARTLLTGVALLLGRATWEEAGHVPMLAAIARDPLWSLGVVVLAVVGYVVQQAIARRA